jgi:predicted outer membrane lipoprotein
MNRLHTTRFFWHIALALAGGLAYLAPLISNLSTAALLKAALASSGIYLGLRCLSARRGTRNATLLACAFALVAALLLGLSTPMVRDSVPSVSITATGDRNPQSLSSEVFVSLIDQSSPAASVFKGDDWEQRGDVYVSYQRQPATLVLQGGWSDGASLNFVSHDHSGKVIVDIGSNRSTLDLYAAQAHSISLALPVPELSWRGLLQQAAIVIALAVFLAGVYVRLFSPLTVWNAGLALSVLCTAATVWTLQDVSYSGALEIVSFDAPAPAAQAHLNTGYGYSSLLVIPLQTGQSQRSQQVHQAYDNNMLRAQALRLVPYGRAQNAVQSTCRPTQDKPCLYELLSTSADTAPTLQLSTRDSNLTIPLPADISTRRTFLLLEQDDIGLTATVSQAYINLAPWNQFSSHVESLAISLESSGYAQKNFRLQTSSHGNRFLPLQTLSDGEIALTPVQRPTTNSLTAMKAMAAMVSGSLVMLLVTLFQATRSLLQIAGRGRCVQASLCLLASFAWFGLLAIISWPAILGWDGLSPYVQVQTGQISLWYGLGYPLFIGGFLLLGPGWLVTIWSLLVGLVIMLGVSVLSLRWSPKRFSRLPVILTVLLLPLSAISIGVVTHLRDAINGLMLGAFVVLAFSLVIQYRCKKTVPEGACIWLLIIACILALLRIDNLPTLILLSVGFIAISFGWGLRTLVISGVVFGILISINPLVARFVLPDQTAAANEKRLYASTALINPLTGMLIYGKEALPAPLYADIKAELNQIMDVDHAINNWTPYNVVYWHQTSNQRPLPSDAVNKQLQHLYVRSMIEAPLLFLKLRTATFGPILGHDWNSLGKNYDANPAAHPSFHDHLLNPDPHWRQQTAIFTGFSTDGHPYPGASQALLTWNAKMASSVGQLLICLLVALFGWRRAPLSSVIALSLLARSAIFFLFAPASVFLYLYDLHFIGILIPFLAITEYFSRSHRKPIS